MKGANEPPARSRWRRPGWAGFLSQSKRMPAGPVGQSGRSQQRDSLVQSLPDRDPQPERQYQYHDRGGRSAEPRLGGTRTERSDERRIMRPPGALQQNPPTRQLIGFLVHHIGLTPARCPLVPPRGTTASGADRRDPHGMVDLQFLGGRRASEDAHPRLARKIGAPERSRTPNPQIRSKRWVRAILRHISP